MITGLMLVVVAVLRFPVPLGEIRLSMQILMEVAVTIMLCIAMIRKNIWFSLFLSLALFSTFYPFYGKIAYLAFQGVFYGALFYFLLVHFLNSEDAILNAMCVLALIQIAFQLCQMLGIPTIIKPLNNGDYLGLMSNVNELSALLAFCLPAFFRKKWVYFIPFVLFGLVMAKSVGGMLSVTAGIVFYLSWRMPRTFLLIPVLGALVLYVAFFDQPVIDARLEAWGLGLKLFKQHWLFGYGMGHWKVVMKNFTIHSQWFSHAHNEFLQATFEMGILFIPIVIGYLVSLYRRFSLDRLVPYTALVIVIVNSMVNFPFHVAPTAMVGVAWLAILQKT